MSTGGSYDPRQVEPAIYAMWESVGAFNADPGPDRPPFVVMMPPPNVTGALHLGHALYTLQDLLTRYRRMCGYEALYLPGTDHAGIATQAVVEKRLREEQGLTRNEIGRAGLVARIWDWKEEYGARILGQLRRIGCSADWRRTRFTLDEYCARAVYEVFFQLFRDGLIFRGPRMVNWDTQLQTAVADDEIVHETVKGHLWHIRYPIAGAAEEWRTARIAAAAARGSKGKAAGQGGDKGADAPAGAASGEPQAASEAGAHDGLGRDYLIVATTRPETMLGDTAVAVHPDDERYQHLIGREVILPLMNRRIPVIADPILVKREFGTGCVKVTPAHDPNDYECGKRNGLAFINILTPDGRINENGRGGPAAGGGAGHDYAGLPKADARKRVVADLDTLGYLDRIEPYETEVGHSDRSKTPIEPLISEQWFVRMGEEDDPRRGRRTSLAELALEAVRDGRVQFYPGRYAKGYLDWLGEKRDWCISRQLWWGHRIPVWTRRMSIGEFDALCERHPGVAHLVGSPSTHICLRVVTARGVDVLLSDTPHVARSALELLRGSSSSESLQWRISVRESESSEGRRWVDELGRLGFEQDPDVLDTWFSSALWPFSTLGWPHPDAGGADGGGPSAADFAYFFPTAVLCTGRDIISLWVVRMVMTALYFTGRVPFSQVYINPTIQDGQGRRMSKSLGNGVDPLDLIDMYGADAMRFTLAQMSGETQDLRIPVAYACPHCGALTQQSSVVPKGKFPYEVKSVTCGACKRQFATAWADARMKQELGVALDTSERFELGRNFCTKLWQAATGFVFPNLESEAAGSAPAALSQSALPLEDRWILTRLSACIADVTRRLDLYQFNEAMNAAYDFFWNEYCDWYVELAKPRLANRTEAGENVPRLDASAHAARRVLAWGLDQVLRLLHPAIPFMTEELWQRLNRIAPRRGVFEVADVAAAEPLLIRARWPGAEALVGQWRSVVGAASAWCDADAAREMQELQGVIRSLRDIRTRLNALRAAGKQPALRTLPRAVVRCEHSVAARLLRNLPQIHRLAQVDELAIGPDQPKPPECFANVLPGIEVCVPVGGLADLGAERQRLAKERDELAGHAVRIEGKLANEAFVARAPAAVIDQERGRLAELRERLQKIETNIAELDA